MNNHNSETPTEANQVPGAGPHTQIGYRLSDLIKEVASGMPDGPGPALKLINKLIDLNLEAWSQRRKIERRQKDLILILRRRLARKRALLEEA